MLLVVVVLNDCVNEIFLVVSLSLLISRILSQNENEKVVNVCLILLFAVDWIILKIVVIFSNISKLQY